jgi:hypothetical protein
MADRRAARGFGPFQTYAASLVKIASDHPELRETPALQKPTRQVSTSALFQRVLMLVQCPFPVESRPPRWWTCSLPSLVLLGTMAASCLTVRVAEVSSPPNLLPMPSAPTKQSFRMSRLVVNPPSQPTGRPHFYELPIRLPESFDLRLEVWGDVDSLAETKVVGLRLLDPNPSSEASSPALSWHRVRICRKAEGLSVLLDQIPIRVAHDRQTTPSLTFETPADSPAHFRNLRLTW